MRYVWPWQWARHSWEVSMVRIEPIVALRGTLIAGGVEHVAEPAPGAVLSRRWTKREALIEERDRLMRAACGDSAERVAAIEARLGTEIDH